MGKTHSFPFFGWPSRLQKLRLLPVNFGSSRCSDNTFTVVEGIHLRIHSIHLRTGTTIFRGYRRSRLGIIIFCCRVGFELVPELIERQNVPKNFWDICLRQATRTIRAIRTKSSLDYFNIVQQSTEYHLVRVFHQLLGHWLVGSNYLNHYRTSLKGFVVAKRQPQQYLWNLHW